MRKQTTRLRRADGTLRGSSVEAEQTGTPPRPKRAAAIRATQLNAIPFESGGAFDSQVASQEFTEALYKEAEQSMHVHARSESPQRRREKRPHRSVEAEEEPNHLRAELETTKAELKKTKAELEKTKAKLRARKQALGRAQRQVEQWRTAAMKVSAAVERAAKEISIATEGPGQDVPIIILSDSD
ncbi:hypothetical protein MVEN_02218300 [Mycena venus]|uniref:Uncharacterized protein n=1 Tax=Mycena venus TaxID=2733690 RepID=A0A8H7CFD8_9AGAR|nr:hypothetical protein MVEN_02218300 [Mycena venus]